MHKSIKECLVDGCSVQARTKGMCKRHYERIRQGKTLEPVQRPDKVCDIEGCAKLARSKSAAYCPMHYHRIYRGGEVGEAEVRKRASLSPSCEIEGCDKPDKTVGYCTMHAARIARHGDPHKVIPVEDRKKYYKDDHWNWVGDAVGYAAAHHRVYRLKGAASDRSCVDCSGPALHWSYDHSDPDENVGMHGGYEVAWSPRPEHYSPRCAPCHKRFDMNQVRARKMADMVGAF